MATFETEDTGGARRRPAATNGGAHNPLGDGIQNLRDLALEASMSVEDLLFLSHDQVQTIAKGQGCSGSLRQALMRSASSPDTVSSPAARC